MKHCMGNIDVLHAATGKSTRLFQQSWLPDGAAKAALILVHGFGEHSGRYEHVARYFTERGFAVYAIDHEGHGKSDGTPGHVERFSVYFDGVTRIVERARAEQGDIPLFLVGHSMGGLIAAAYLMDHQDEFAGCVLSGPALASDAAPPSWLRAINRLLSALLPKLGMIKLDATGVSRDPDVVERYLADPLVFKGKLTARLLDELLGQADAVLAHAGEIRLPILLLHGEADQLTAPSGSIALHETVASDDKTLKIYPGLFHEIFNEPEKEQVLADMYAWLDQHRT